MLLPYVKRFFQEYQWSAFLFMAQNTQIPRDQRSQFENNTFSKKNFYGSFGIVSTWCRNIFWRAALKPFSVYGSNFSDSLVFGNGPFGEMKYRSLRKRSFHTKKIAMEVLGMCLCYGKKYFQGHQWSTFVSIGQITEIFFSFGECGFWRDQRSQFENDIFSKKNFFQWRF